MKISLNITIPPEAKGTADIRRAYRGSVIRALRRGMQDLVDDVDGNVPPRFQGGFAIVQDTGGADPSVGVAHKDEVFWYWENPTRAHRIPVKWISVREGSLVRKWLDARGINPYAWKHAVEERGYVNHPGTRGTFVLRGAVQRHERHIYDLLDAATARFLKRLGRD